MSASASNSTSASAADCAWGVYIRGAGAGVVAEDGLPVSQTTLAGDARCRGGGVLLLCSPPLVNEARADANGTERLQTSGSFRLAGEREEPREASEEPCDESPSSAPRQRRGGGGGGVFSSGTAPGGAKGACISPQ